MLNFFSKANKIQKILLIVTIPSNALVVVLTWYSVIFTDMANESSRITKYFISNFGVVGLLLIFVIFSGSFFVFWSLWVNISKKEVFDRTKLERGGFLVSFSFAVLMFVIAVFDLANDLLVFWFEVDFLVPFLSPCRSPWLSMVPILIAFILGVSVIYSSQLSQIWFYIRKRLRTRTE